MLRTHEKRGMNIERVAVIGSERCVVVVRVAGWTLRLHVGEGLCFWTGDDGALIARVSAGRA